MGTLFKAAVRLCVFYLSVTLASGLGRVSMEQGKRDQVAIAKVTSLQERQKQVFERRSTDLPKVALLRHDERAGEERMFETVTGWTVLLDKDSYGEGPAYGRIQGCSPAGKYSRRLAKDEFVSRDEAEVICQATDRAMKNLFHRGGSTSLVPDETAAERLGPSVFDTIQKLKERVLTFVKEQYAIEDHVYHAGSMLTRLTVNFDPGDGWEVDPNYDYSNPHVDKANRAAYDYSALLYLNDGGGVNFTGGNFHFLDTNADYTITPRSGRLITFTSGLENPHRVETVTSGTRYVLAMWFTCSRKHSAQSVFSDAADDAANMVRRNARPLDSILNSPSWKRINPNCSGVFTEAELTDYFGSLYYWELDHKTDADNSFFTWFSDIIWGIEMIVLAAIIYAKAPANVVHLGKARIFTSVSFLCLAGCLEFSAVYHAKCASVQSGCYFGLWGICMVFQMMSGAFLLSASLAICFKNQTPVYLGFVNLAMWAIFFGLGAMHYFQEVTFLVSGVLGTVFPVVALYVSSIASCGPRRRVVVSSFTLGFCIFQIGFAIQIFQTSACATPCPRKCLFPVRYINHNGAMHLSLMTAYPFFGIGLVHLLADLDEVTLLISKRKEKVG